MECELELPYPPSVNHYKKIGRLVKTKSGKLCQWRVNTPKTKQFYFEVWTKLRVAFATQGLKSFQDSTISMEVDVFPPDHRKRDLDGILKVLLDSMQRGGLYVDDFQIVRLTVERKYIVPQGKVIVRIKNL